MKMEDEDRGWRWRMGMRRRMENRDEDENGGWRMGMRMRQL